MVVDCSAEAALLGIGADMPLAEAEALISGAGKRKESLKILEHDPLADRMAMEQLAIWCQQFTPAVSLAGQTCDALWLDTTGVSHLFGDEEGMLRHVGNKFRDDRWTVHLALADTHAGAWAIAKYRAKRDRPLCVPVGESSTMLACAPLGALQLPEPIIKSLREVGIEQVGQLEQLPRSSLASRLGEETCGQLDRLLGHRPDVLAVVKSDTCWEGGFEFEVPVTAHEILLRVLEGLFKGLADRLSAEQLGATLLAVRFHCPPALPLELAIEMFRPSADPNRWLELVSLQLERAHLPAPVSAIIVTAENVGRLIARQQTLFADEDRSRENEQLLGELVERLTSRLGHQAVARVFRVPDPIPERCYRLMPAILGGKSPSQQVEANPIAPMTRPTELKDFSQVGVVTAPDGAPAAFDWQGTRFRLSKTWGPERIESGWWRGASVRRDYYRVETIEGSQAWLFRDLNDKRWFLHSWFQ